MVVAPQGTMMKCEFSIEEHPVRWVHFILLFFPCLYKMSTYSKYWICKNRILHIVFNTFC